MRTYTIISILLLFFLLLSGCRLFEVPQEFGGNEALEVTGYYSSVSQEIIWQWTKPDNAKSLQYRINDGQWQDIDVKGKNYLISTVSPETNYNLQIKSVVDHSEILKECNIQTSGLKKNDLGSFVFETINSRPVIYFPENNLTLEYKVDDLFGVWNNISNNILRYSSNLELGEHYFYIRTKNEKNEYCNYIYKILVSEKRQIRLFADQDITESITKPAGYDFTDEFTISIEIGDKIYLDSKINLHGASSLGYSRKSYEIRLKPGLFINIFGDVYTDTFLLISMDADMGYINHIFAFKILEELGLFLPFYRLYEVEINYKTNGMYMLVEKSQNGIVRKNPNVEFVLRRRYYPDYDLKYYSSSATIKESVYIDTYNEIYEILDDYSGEDLYDELTKLMDIDGYMRWIAFNTFVQNGDYSDEVFFYAIPDLIEVGKPYFKISSWDYDDLFMPPHWGNYLPGSLVYCNEQILDKKIEDDIILYNKYKDIFLDLLVNNLTEEYLINIFNDSISELGPFLERKEIYSIQHNVSDGTDTSWAQNCSFYNDRLKLLIQRRNELISLLQ